MLNRRVILSRRPDGLPTAADFAIDEAPLPALGDGELLVRNILISLDPGMRQRLSQVDSYVPLIPIGDPLTTTTLGEVVQSRHADYADGDLIVGFHTIADYSVTVPGPLTRRITRTDGDALSHHLGILGPTGLTAYAGLIEIGKPKPGETVLVSAAAGAVGSVAAQIARIKGCRAIGIAGGPEKCRRLIDEFGLDAAIDYRGRDLAALTAAIREAAPEGIDVFFDNVGGIQLDAALDVLTIGARVALCGLISQYNASEPVALTNLFKLIAKSARIEGFAVLRHSDIFPTALRDLSRWIASGQLHFREQIGDGLDQAVPMFLKLFDGSNDGKLMVRLASD